MAKKKRSRTSDFSLGDNKDLGALPSKDLINTVVANDIIYAIHQDQLDVKEGLYDQNPGY